MKDEGRRMKDEGKRMKDEGAMHARFILHPSSFILLFAFCLFTFSLQNCTPDPDPTLNYKDREVVDSIFRVKIDTLKLAIDSLCEMRYDSAVQFKVDSIMEVRQSEIKKYLERIRRSEQ